MKDVEERKVSREFIDSIVRNCASFNVKKVERGFFVMTLLRQYFHRQQFVVIGQSNDVSKTRSFEFLFSETNVFLKLFRGIFKL